MKENEPSIKYITFGLFRDVSFAKHHRSPYRSMVTLPQMHAVFHKKLKNTDSLLPPQDKAVVFVPQVASTWECCGVRKYQHPKCRVPLFSTSSEGAINHSPSLHPSAVFIREAVLIISVEYLWVVPNLWHCPCSLTDGGIVERVS